MLLFHDVKISDMDLIKSIFSSCASQSCDATFGNLFLWQEQYSQRVCFYKDTLFLRYGEEYLFPIGKLSTKESIEVLLEDARERNVPFRMKLVTDEQCENLRQFFPNEFNYTYDRDNSDYVYETEKLITLAGKKYHSKRNHIAKFDRMYNWSYEKMTMDNIAQCKSMNDRWEKEYNVQSEGLKLERIAIENAFENFLKLKLIGGVLKVENEVVAFSIGERINNETFCTHFEKALSSFEGAYTKMNNLFSQNELKEYRYVNREEDMGIEGIRKSKTSYNPIFLLDKYTVTCKK